MGPSPLPAPGGAPRGLVFGWLFVGSCAAAYGVFLLSLLSLLVAEDLGLSEATLGLAFAGLGLGGLASPFIGGVLADRASPRPVSLGGLGSVALGALLVSLSPGPLLLGVGEFLMGAGLSVFNVMAYAWINQSLGARKGFYLGLYLTSLTIGLGVAGLTLALLLSRVGWRTFYEAAALGTLVPAVALSVLLPRTPQLPRPGGDLRRALAHRDVQWTASLQFLIGLGGGGFSWLPWFLVEERGLPLTSAILAFVATAALWGLGGMAFGRIADAGWPRPTIALGGLATGLAYLAFLMVGLGPQSLALLFLYAFLWPAGAQVPVTFLGQRLGEGSQRTELGLLENLFLIGDATGAALVGFLAGTWGLPLALAVIPGAATLLAGLLFGMTYGIGPGVGTVAAAMPPTQEAT